MHEAIMNLFVYLPAALFYILIGVYFWARRGDKKNRERHEDDGK